jgi:hypothetical protein
MTYYPVWFDGVTWTAIAGGVVCFLAMKAIAVGPKRGYVKLAACLLMAIGLGFGGAGGVLFNARAPHLEANGTISYVAIHSGRGSSTTFTLITAQGTLKGLSISAARDQIATGEHAQVFYQAESMRALEVHVLDGPGADFSYSDSDGTVGAAFTLFAALMFGIYGVVNFITGGTGAPALDDNSPSPPGDADSKSILDI